MNIIHLIFCCESGNFMKKDLGKTLRTIRKGKQVSLNSLADENLSKSQISRFERGESEISCIRLINILDKLNVSIDEFMVIHDEEYSETENFFNLMYYIRQQLTLKNYGNIKKLLENNTEFIIGNYEKTMIKSIIYSFDKSVFPEENERM